MGSQLVMETNTLATPGRNPSALAWRNKCDRHRLQNTKF